MFHSTSIVWLHWSGCQEEGIGKMQSTLTESRYREVTVLSPEGHLMGGELTEKLYSRVRDLVLEGFSLVVIDLSQVPWINSSGIGTLMGCRSECLARDGQFLLAGANIRIEELLKSLKLDTILFCHSNMEEAVVMMGGEMAEGNQ